MSEWWPLPAIWYFVVALCVYAETDEARAKTREPRRWNFAAAALWPFLVAVILGEYLGRWSAQRQLENSGPRVARDETRQGP